MNHALLDMLACPCCHGDVVYRPDEAVLICKADRLAFPVRNAKPIMLVSEAQELTNSAMNDLLGRSA